MTVSTPLQRFVEDELSRSDALADRTLAGTIEQFARSRPGTAGAAELQQHRALIDVLQRIGGAFRLEFSQQMQVLVRADLDGIGAASDLPSHDPGRLQLMDEARVESDIEISRAAQLIDATAEWELRELQTFVSTLAGQTHVTPESNPLRPLSYARALWAATCLVTSVPVQRGILVRTAAGVIAGELKKAWAAACTRLESQGVEPGIYRTVVFQPSQTTTAARVPQFDVTRPGGIESLLSTLPRERSVASPGASSPGAQALATEQGSRASLEQVLAQFDALLQRAEAAATDVPASGLRNRLLASAATSPERQTIELLSRLFEAVLADPRLPSALRSTMTRLQVTALRVALSDPAMLGTHDHPVWHLMNRIAAAGEPYVFDDDPRLVALAAFCEG